MPTFTWHDCLTVSVHEMSRADALDCARQFDLLAGVIPNVGEYLAEINALIAVKAPAAVRFQGVLLNAGPRHLVLSDEEAVDLTLPLTREAFDALPMSLATAWSNAASAANDWVVEALKKILLPVSPSSSASKSDSGPSAEPAAILPATTTNGS